MILHSTIPAVCIDKVVVMNSGEELFNKVYESPRSPRRIVLKPALHDGRQDTASIEARASNTHSSKCRETCSGEIPFYSSTRRSHTQGSSQQVDSSIRNASKSRGVESRLEAKLRVQPIQRKVAGHDPQHGKLAHWAKGIVYCSCGTCLRPKHKNAQIEQGSI